MVLPLVVPVALVVMGKTTSFLPQLVVQVVAVVAQVVEAEVRAVTHLTVPTLGRVETVTMELAVGLAVLVLQALQAA